MTFARRAHFHPFFVPVAALVLVVSCRSPAAYGPSGDERLARAVGGTAAGEAGAGNAEHLATIEQNSCSNLIDPLADLLASAPEFDPMAGEEQEEGPNLEEDHLANLTGALRELRRRRGEISDVLGNRPDLAFFSGPAADGRSYDVPEIVRECDGLLEQAELALDSYIREILSMPVVTEVRRVRRRTINVNRERVDLSLLAASIELLAPFDADSLMSRVESARARVNE